MAEGVGQTKDCIEAVDEGGAAADADERIHVGSAAKQVACAVNKIFAVDEEHGYAPEHLQQGIDKLIFLPKDEAWQRPAPHSAHVLIEDKAGKNHGADEPLAHCLHFLRCCVLWRAGRRGGLALRMNGGAEAKPFNAGDDGCLVNNAFIEGDVRIIR